MKAETSLGPTTASAITSSGKRSMRARPVTRSSDSVADSNEPPIVAEASMRESGPASWTLTGRRVSPIASSGATSWPNTKSFWS